MLKQYMYLVIYGTYIVCVFEVEDYGYTMVLFYIKFYPITLKQNKTVVLFFKQNKHSSEKWFTILIWIVLCHKWKIVNFNFDNGVTP